MQIIVYFLVRVPVPNLSAADRRRRTRRRDLARAVLARRRRPQRRLHDLLTMADKSNNEFGKRKPVSVPASPRPGAATGQALGPCRAAADGYGCGRQRRLRADAEPQLRATAECGLAIATSKAAPSAPPRSSSSSSHSSGSGGSSSRSSYYSSNSSPSHSSSGTSDSASHSAQRGGFGSFGHAVGFSGG